MIASRTCRQAVAEPRQDSPEALIVGEAVQVIRARSCCRLSVPQLAEAVGVSRRWLAKWFPPIIGCSPHEAIRRAVFLRVEELLRETDLTIAEIAAQTGFKHSEYLAAAFRVRYGLPPGRWRRRQASGRPPESCPKPHFPSGRGSVRSNLEWEVRTDRRGKTL